MHGRNRATRFRTSTRIFRAAQNPYRWREKIPRSLSLALPVLRRSCSARRGVEFAKELRNLSSRPYLLLDQYEYSAGFILRARAASSCKAGGQGLMKLAEKNANKVPVAVNVDAVALFSLPCRGVVSPRKRSSAAHCRPIKISESAN